MGRVSREHILLPPGYGTGMLVAVADTTAADYPGDSRCRCYQPPQASPGVAKLARAAPGCVVGRARPGRAVAGRGRRRQALPMRALVASAEVVGGWVPPGGAHAHLCDPAMSGQVLP